MSRQHTDDSELEERPKKRRTQTIEATGKVWKAMQLLGGLGMLTFAITIALKMNGFAGADAPAFGFFAFVAGFPLWLFGRLGAWWYHG